MKFRAIVLSALALAVLMPFHNCAPAGDSNSDNGSLSFEYSPISLKVAAGYSDKIDEGTSTQLEVGILKPQPVDLKLQISLTQTGLDFQLPVSEITLPAGQSSVKFNVQALSDATIENDETAVVQVMYKDAPAPTGTGPLTLTAVDKSPVPVLTMSALSVQEGSKADLIIHSSYAIAKDITFNLGVTLGTASASDFTISSVTAIKIPANATSVKVEISALADALIENNETLSVKILNPVHATASATGTTITISDNTVLPTLSVAAATAAEGTLITFPVSLSAASKYPTTFTFATEDGTGIAGKNYDGISGSLTIPAGQKAALISVKGRDDGLHNANLNFKLKIAVTSGAANASASAMGTFVESLKCDSKNLIRLASAFGKNMVLHEDMPRIWGTARPNTNVQVSLKGRAGALVVARADAKGNFLATIPVSNIAKGATEIQIKNNCEEDSITGVLIGEVWLCSGQSNMDFAVKASTSAAEVKAEAATADVKNNIRLFGVALNKTLTELTQFPVVAGKNQWEIPDANTVSDFSAVCYHFGRELQKKLQKPIGLIHSSYGGTAIEEWVQKGDMPAKYMWPNSTRQDAAAYNGMISPLVPMKLSGVAWYQGESNQPRAVLYKSQLKYWTASWRKLFLNNVLDFHLVGLASYKAAENPTAGAAVPTAGGFAQIREAQLEYAAVDKHVSVANAIGTVTAAELAAGQIHPANKKTVGERLARAALTKTYANPETMPQWDFAGTEDSGAVVKVKLKFPIGMALPAVGTEIAGFQVKLGSAYKYAKSAKVASSSAGVVIIAVTGASAASEVRYEFHDAPKIGYVTPVNKDPLYPLCVKKNGTKWEQCADSYQ
jgi:sialate O-acetylesterase